MPPAPQSKILLAGDPIPVGVQGAMESGGCGITLTGLVGVDPAGVSLFHAVLLCVTVDQIARAQALCRRWRIELGEQFVPIVWRAPPEVPGQAGLDCGADVVLPATVSNEHLVSQFKALLRVQQQHNRLASRAAEAQSGTHIPMSDANTPVNISRTKLAPVATPMATLACGYHS